MRSDTGSRSQTDEELARAAALGDRAAFDALVRRTLPSLLRYAKRMVRDTPTADDIVQETLIAAWKGLPRFGFRSSFRTWVFGIAHRKIINLRRRRVELSVDDRVYDAIVDGAPGPGATAIGSTMLEALQRELAQLPYLSRASWWLREMEGLSHQEIAVVLAISPGSVRGHLQRTRRQLAIRMAPWRPSDAVEAEVAVGSRTGKGANP